MDNSNMYGQPMMQPTQPQPNVFITCNAKTAASFVNVIINGNRYTIHGGEQMSFVLPIGQVPVRFETRYRSGLALASPNRGYDKVIPVYANRPTYVEVKLMSARNEINIR